VQKYASNSPIPVICVIESPNIFFVPATVIPTGALGYPTATEGLLLSVLFITFFKYPIFFDRGVYLKTLIFASKIINYVRI
jgi:hypothetical protein